MLCKLLGDRLRVKGKRDGRIRDGRIATRKKKDRVP